MPLSEGNSHSQIQSCRAWWVLKNIRFMQQSSHKTRCFRKSCPSASSTENGCAGPDQRLGLLSILLPTVAINGCPKGENKNRVSTYNTPVSLFICLHPSPLLPPPVTHSSLSSWRGFCLFSGNPLIYFPFTGPLPHQWWKLLVSTISLTTTSCTGQHLPKESPTSDLLQLGSYYLPLAPPHPCVTRQWTIPILLVSCLISQASVTSPFLVHPAEGF